MMVKSRIAAAGSHISQFPFPPLPLKRKIEYKAKKHPPCYLRKSSWQKISNFTRNRKEMGWRWVPHTGSLYFLKDWIFWGVVYFNQGETLSFLDLINLLGFNNGWKTFQLCTDTKNSQLGSQTAALLLGLFPHCCRKKGTFRASVPNWRVEQLGENLFVFSGSKLSSYCAKRCAPLFIKWIGMPMDFSWL